MDVRIRNLRSISNPLVFSVLLILALGVGPGVRRLAAQEAQMTDQAEPTRLAVLWTSGDPEVAMNVAFMYTLNAKIRGWFDEVTLIVWGPSADLLTRDVELQDQLRQMATEGITLLACKACADRYGAAEKLEALGVEVKYMGVPLTEMLQGDWKVITF